jgi:YggT family protein
VIQALIYIIEALSTLVLIAFLLRFWLPWFRVDFRNPVAQAILRITSPLIVPIRRVLPPIGKLDTATIVVMFGIKYLTIWIVLLLAGVTAGILTIAIASVFGLVHLSVNIFMFVIIISIVLSWIAPNTYNPVSAMVHAIAEPLLRPFRRLVPPLGGIDISPVFALILLGALRILLIQWQAQLT